MALIISTAYPGKTTPPSAGYPQGSAQNVTVPGDDTGTPWEQLLLDDLLGFQQMLIDSAGITPSGSPDEVGASQYFEAMQKCAGFPGAFVPVGFNDIDPSIFGVRILILDGSAIDIVDYPELVATTYVGDSANAAAGGIRAGFYKASDIDGDVPDIAGPYYILPNAFGRFMRGIDDGAGIDPDGERYVGEPQLDCVISHKHGVFENLDPWFSMAATSSKDLGTGSDTLFYGVSGPPSGVTDVIAGGRWHNEAEYGTQFYQGPAGAASKTVEEESRPSNITCRWGVWY